MDLQKQFKVRNDEKTKYFYFDAQTNLTTSYSIHYSECDGEEANAWISISKAIKKDYPNLLIE